MVRKDYKIIFMGTSEFAVPILEKLASSNFNIVGVFCQPDRQKGRGLKYQHCAMKNIASQYNFSLFQPENLKNKVIAGKIQDLKPELIIVAAYGLIIPRTILEIPRHGCLNVHPSLLSRYRGSSPIQGAIIDGEKETGVTVMLLDEKVDHGPILAQRKIKIEQYDDIFSLSERLAKRGANLLLKILPLYLAGEIKPVQQDHMQATLTKIIRKEDGQIDWSEDAARIARKIRAYLGWPGSFIFWGEKRIIILEAEAKNADRYREKNGEVFNINSEIYVQCGQNVLKIKKLRLEGKKEVTGVEFLRGYVGIIGAVLR
ncbi:MAG: methionyl-tRNA formyltransferase [Candidatus Doudnabacteria bacterium]